MVRERTLLADQPWFQHLNVPWMRGLWRSKIRYGVKDQFERHEMNYFIDAVLHHSESGLLVLVLSELIDELHRVAHDANDQADLWCDTAALLLDHAEGGRPDLLPARLPDHVQVMRAMPYAFYLQTEHWKRVAADVKERAGGRCAVCNADGPLDAHHRTYERLGEEADGDVIALCRKCHGLFHKRAA